MSLGELIFILVVAVVFLKPEDIKLLSSKFHVIKKQYYRAHTLLLSYFNLSFVDDSSLGDSVSNNNNIADSRSNKASCVHCQARDISNDVKDINYYLERIIAIEGKYDGDYSVDHLKSYYHELLQSQLKIFNNVNNG